MQAFATFAPSVASFASRSARVCSRFARPIAPIRTAMSAAAVSAVPGVKTIEDQTVKSPVTEASTVLIVGASRGIGLEFVRQCAAKNARVYATYRRTLPAGLAALKDEYADKVMPIPMDVTDSSSITAARDAMGSDVVEKISHVVHNAGIATFGGLSQVTAGDMLDCYKVNAMGVVLVAQVFAPHLKSSTRPVYGILTSKVGSVDDNGSGGMYAYRASKSACCNIAKSLSIDLADSVSVVLLHPGFVRTDVSTFLY